MEKHLGSKRSLRLLGISMDLKTSRSLGERKNISMTGL